MYQCIYLLVVVIVVEWKWLLGKDMLIQMRWLFWHILSRIDCGWKWTIYLKIWEWLVDRWGSGSHRQDELESERLTKRSRGWFHRLGEVCWKEQSIISGEGDIDRWASVIRDETHITRLVWVKSSIQYNAVVRGLQLCASWIMAIDNWWRYNEWTEWWMIWQCSVSQTGRGFTEF